MENNKETGLFKLIKERVRKEKNRPTELDPQISDNEITEITYMF